MPSYQELRLYLNNVAEKYDLSSKMLFSMSVEKCVWREDVGRWLLFVRNLDNDVTFLHECQVLFSATGQLSHPAELDIPGKESFKGDIFHSARWDHNVSLADKNVVLIGNGCAYIPYTPSSSLPSSKLPCRIY
jgi:cation diffusion facilitator CzcD-associated flavoprotein CzcO